ncbi:methyltransferase domain-containing protein [Ureibacillus chungkukjangi]|uniref:class I SAM-dependent methyltransferase n=1 Tax=Ureibacillus chungkukjangi TaxID=1202712 RepID=UPI0020413753|nr:class I SAM-dependent methyltransferase [Ureibacillus chungkukjangi]MCM3388102.1 methyltransferase domain-containing protein [Ureibacillus chungkukjangi]
MGIDFHNEKNRNTYSTRKADTSWIKAIKNLVQFDNISKALDIGCGGGIYSKALSDMGVASVTGVDFSEEILKGARGNCKEYPNISFQQGDALHTGLESNNYNLLLERALIHHIDDLKMCFEEAYRLLKDDGIYIVQDRTPEDCLSKGNDSHIRGYFFELFPELIEKETKRRHNSQFVLNTLQEVGFKKLQEVKLWETRKVYKHKEQLLKDLSERTGRSILHELDDEKLNVLINYIDEAISIENNIVEKDRWTIWIAVK